MYGYGTLKSVKAILRRGRVKRENNGGYEHNRDTLYTYGNVTMQPSVQLSYINYNI
jgi:hypothetical protein